MIDTRDFLGHIRTESQRFADLLQSADPSAPVPTCADWTAADLLWHLTEVQAFWITIVEQRLTTPWDAVAAAPERPDDYNELLALFTATNDRVMKGLETTPPETPAWMWHKGDESVGYIIRRQAHEACIHRLDAELVLGEMTAIDQSLADDGVDEVLRIIFATPAWAEFRANGATAEIHATDTGRAWAVALGRSDGTEPDDGTKLDEPAMLTEAPTSDAAGTAQVSVSGTAEHLDKWLWRRAGADQLTIAGDPDAQQALFTVIENGVA